MKSRFSVFVALMCIFMLAAVSAMAVDASGLTSGGTLGKATGYANLSISNSSQAGMDKAIGKTRSSVEDTSNASNVTIYYVGKNGSGSKNATATSKGTTWATATAKVDEPTGQGYKASSGHAVLCSTYGSWSKGLSQEW